MTNNTTQTIDIKQMKADVAARKKIEDKENSKPWFKNVIIGLGYVLLFASITFSTIMILYGTDDIVSRVMIAPQGVYAASLLIYGFVNGLVNNRR